MKLALRYIPTEVWVDVFSYPWITRKRLAKIVDKFRNRKFAEFLQFYLHDWGKRTLGKLNLSKSTLSDIPRSPMPENIKFFENIRIWHFDSRTLDFLRHINGLFNSGVNLHFGYFASSHDLANLRTILGHISPMLHGIHSLSFNQRTIPLMQQYFTSKLAQVKMILFSLHSEPADPATAQAVNFCMNWLTLEERDPAEPAFLKVYSCSEILQQFVLAMQQEFHLAKRQCTFAIEFICYGNLDQSANFHLENDLGDQLDGQFDGYGNCHIYRHKQVDSARTQLEEWVKNTAEKRYISSYIEIDGSVTIGQMDANAGANEVNDNAGEEEDGLSTSG